MYAGHVQVVIMKGEGGKGKVESRSRKKEYSVCTKLADAPIARGMQNWVALLSVRPSREVIHCNLHVLKGGLALRYVLPCMALDGLICVDTYWYILCDPSMCFEECRSMSVLSCDTFCLSSETFFPPNNEIYTIYDTCGYVLCNDIIPILLQRP